jgi:hypothetical protein
MEKRRIWTELEKYHCDSLGIYKRIWGESTIFRWKRGGFGLNLKSIKIPSKFTTEFEGNQQFSDGKREDLD